MSITKEELIAMIRADTHFIAVSISEIIIHINEQSYKNESFIVFF